MSTQDELREVEEDLAKLKAALADVVDQISTMGATDMTERSSMIAMADDHRTVILELEAWRDELLSRLSKEG